MAITVQRFRRAEVWNKWAAAGGTRQAIISVPIELAATSKVDSTDPDSLSLTVPLNGDAAPFIVPGAVIRVDEADAHINDIPWARDLTSPHWNVPSGGSGSATLNATGIDGTPNTATTLSDTDAVNVQQAYPNAIAISADSRLHYFQYRIAKDAVSSPVTSLFADLVLSGSHMFRRLDLNTQTGAFFAGSSAPAPPSFAERVTSSPDNLWWIVEMVVQNDGTRTVAQPTIYIAGPTGTSQRSVAIGYAHHEPNMGMPAVPVDPIITSGATGSVDATFDEWVVLDGPNDDDGAGTRSVQAFPVTAAMASCEFVRRIDSDGTSVLDFESVGLTPTQHIANWVIPALTRAGLTWIVAGNITPTKLLNLTFSWDSPLSVLQRIAEQTECELDIRRTPTGYAIDIVAQIASSAPIADLRFDKNLQPGSKRARNMVNSSTRVYARGANEDLGYATMNRATWQVSNLVGSVVTLSDPVGGAGPIQFDGQLAGVNGTTQAYLRKANGTLTQVTASSSSAQSVTVASAAGITIGDMIQFRADNAGNDLLWLDSPADFALYGLKIGMAEMADVPSTNNLIKNSVMRLWPGAASSPPPAWTKVGGGTVDRQAAAPYTRIGGFSIHRVGAADGDGVISDAVSVFPTALNPYVSGYAGLWVVSGQVRVELVFTTPGGPVVQPIAPDVASNSIIGQWEDLGVSGIDANALGATAVQLRVVQHGSTVADFYLDYGQATQSPSQLPFDEASGGTRLWQAANDKLSTDAAPLVSYDVPIVDLAALDPVTWGGDCKVVVGGKVRITDPKLGVGVIVRLVELQRNYLVPGATRIRLSNKPKAQTNILAGGLAPGRSEPDTGEASAAGYQSAKAKVIASLNPGTYPDSQYATVIVTSDDPTATVQLVGVSGTATLASGAAAGSAQPQNGVNNVWVFARGAINAGQGQAQFRAKALGKFDDDDFVTIEEQGRDTVPLAVRARVTATTPTTLTVRVAVADPFPQGANSATIAYSNLGTGGVSPATGQTVTPASTLTEAAGTFVDFTVTRPAFGAGAGRVTFTVTAAGRTSDSDAVDVPEADRDTIPLSMRARVTATTPTQITVRVAVSDPFPQGTNSVIIDYLSLGTGAVSPATGQLITPAAILTEAAGTFVDFTVNRPAFGAGAGRVTFTASNANRVSSQDAIDVPEVDRDTQQVQVRIERVSETASDITVRVKAITPNSASSTCTISYNAGGLGVSPASGGSYSGFSNDFATTAFVDFVITRDVQGGTPRRVAFTVSSGGYVDGTDAVDVPPNSSRYFARVFRTASQSISTATPTKISWDSESYDLPSNTLHSTVSSPTRITVPSDWSGAAILMAQIAFEANSSGDRRVDIFKNGSSIANIQVRACANAAKPTVLPVSIPDVPVAGDYYEVEVTHDAGVSLGVGSGFGNSFFGIIQII